MTPIPASMEEDIINQRDIEVFWELDVGMGGVGGMKSGGCCDGGGGGGGKGFAAEGRGWWFELWRKKRDMVKGELGRVEMENRSFVL